ncbi:MAG: cytochrome c maturation protein CcmE [Bacteroidia bacterium]
MKKSHIALIIIVVIALGTIISTVSSSSTYETFAVAFAHEGKEFHVVGELNRTKALEYNPQINANEFAFYLSDSTGTEKHVIYAGTKPQDFEHAEKIVIVGKADGADFRASQILMKCPSKYNNNKEGLVPKS